VAHRQVAPAAVAEREGEILDVATADVAERAESAMSVASLCWIPCRRLDGDEGLTVSLLGMVRVADFAPVLVGVNLTWKGKQKSGLIVTGYPDDGAVTENCALDDVMFGSMTRSAIPVLQTFSVAVVELPTHASSSETLPGPGSAERSRRASS